MRRRRNLWLTAGAAVVVAVGVSAGVTLAASGPVAAPDQAQVNAVLPAITAYLQSPAYRNLNSEYSPTDYQTRRVRWVCTAAVVYIDSQGTQLRAGMDVACGNYERQGNKVLMEYGGDMGHEVMALSGADRRYQVVSAAQEPGISPDPAWISRNFPAPAAAEVNDGRAPMASTPDSKALLALGCTTGSTRASVITDGQGGDALGWRCTSP